MLELPISSFVPNQSSCNSGAVTQDWTPSKNNKDVTQDWTPSKNNKDMTQDWTPSKNNKDVTQDRTLSVKRTLTRIGHHPYKH